MKIFFLPLLLSVVVFFAPESRAEKPPITIGATLALSGRLAYTGQAQQAGMELAVSDINAAGGIAGRSLRLVSEDNAGDPKRALSGVNKLLTVDRADVIFSSFTPVTQAIKNAVRRSGKIMIYQATLADIARESPLFFRDWTDAREGGALLAEAAGVTGKRKIAVIYVISDSSEAIMSGFLAAAEKQGLKILTSNGYNAGEADFRSLLLRMKASDPDAIVCIAFQDSAQIMYQMEELGMLEIRTFHYNAPFVPAPDEKRFRAVLEKNRAVSNWIGFVEADLNPEQKKFYSRIQQKYGIEPRVEAALSFDDIPCANHF